MRKATVPVVENPAGEANGTEGEIKAFGPVAVNVLLILAYGFANPGFVVPLGFCDTSDLRKVIDRVMLGISFTEGEIVENLDHFLFLYISSLAAVRSTATSGPQAN